MPTLAELSAQQAALTKALAAHELPLFEAAAEALTDLVQSDGVQRIVEIAGQLPDSGAKNAIANVHASMSAAVNLITMHLPRLRELAGAASPLTQPGGRPGELE